MKTTLKSFLMLAFAGLALASCKIQEVDYFVPEVTNADGMETIAFLENGGSKSVAIEANCDWTASCPADWVTLSEESGENDVTLTVTVGATRLPRTTTVTIASNEVLSRCVEITVTQKGVKEISSVAEPKALNLQSVKGFTADLNASFELLGLEDGDTVTGGFVVNGKEVSAAVDVENAVLSASLTDLTPGVDNKCKAWACINGGTKVYSTEITFVTEKAAAELTSVSDPVVKNTTSDDGTTATLTGEYVASVILGPEFDFKAGFEVAQGGSSTEYEVSGIDFANSGFSKDISGLTPNTEYTVRAWAQLDGNKIYSQPVKFTPKVALKAGTYEFKFDGDPWKAIPTKADGCKSDGASKVYTIVDGDFTWQVCGCFIDGGCMRIGSSNKVGYDGWAIMPVFPGLTATRIIVPNDGSGSSGSCMITIQVSEDGGSSWKDVPGCVGHNIKNTSETTIFDMADQKPGSMYKICNVKYDGKQGNSKSTKITIVVK